MLKILVGLSLASVMGELLFGGGSYKKYVNAILGIFTLLVIVEGVFSLEPIKDVNKFYNEAEELTKLTLSEAEKEIAEGYEENIKNKLVSDGFSVSDVKVFLNSSLELKNLNIYVNEKGMDRDIIKALDESFGINPNLVKIEIKEEN